MTRCYTDPVENSIPDEVKPLFWDVDPVTMDLAANAEFVVSRILESTTPAALEWLERTYTRDRILAINRTSRKISERSRNFWNLWYGAAS